jgi:hypothetical protein
MVRQLQPKINKPSAWKAGLIKVEPRLIERAGTWLKRNGFSVRLFDSCEAIDGTIWLIVSARPFNYQKLKTRKLSWLVMETANQPSFELQYTS